MRAKRDLLAQGDPGKRGPGRPKGSTNKAPGSPTPQVVAPVVDRSGLYKKMGMAWRGVGLCLSLSTNCTVWALGEEEEKILGEAYGDVCADLGFADTMAVKMVFLAGTTLGVFGPKTLGYVTFLNQQKALSEAAKKGHDPKPKQPTQDQEKNPAVTPDHKPEGFADSSGIHETRPGRL